MDSIGMPLMIQKKKTTFFPTSSPSGGGAGVRGEFFPHHQGLVIRLEFLPWNSNFTLENGCLEDESFTFPVGGSI